MTEGSLLLRTKGPSHTNCWGNAPGNAKNQIKG